MPRILRSRISSPPAGCNGVLDLTGSLDWDATASSTGIVSPAYGDYIYALAQKTSTNYWKLYVIDVSDPANPSVNSSQSLTYTDGISKATIRKAFIHGSLLYLVGWWTGAANNITIRTFDLSTPTAPAAVDTWNSTIGYTQSFGFMFENGGSLYLASWGKVDASNFGLRIWNIDDVGSTVQADSIAIPDPDAEYPNWNNIYYDGSRYAYGVRESSVNYTGSVDSIDIDDPTNLALVDALTSITGQYVPNGGAIAHGALWYSLQNADDSFSIYGVNLADPTNLVAAGSIDNTGEFYAGLGSGNCVYLAGDSADPDYNIEYVVVDAGTIASPSICKTLLNDYANEPVDLHGGYLIDNGYNWSTRTPRLQILNTL